MPTLREVLTAAAGVLEAAGVAAPRLTAEVLAAHTLNRDRAWLYAHGEEELSPPAASQLQTWTRRRAGGEPLQYITGVQEFMGREFRVSPAVLIPRPETELVAEVALELAGAGARIADVGTGSGCLAVTLALEQPQARVTATDISPAALEVARGNAQALGAAVNFVPCDLLAGVTGVFDLIVSNPPYVAEAELASLQPEVREHEPRTALVAGPRGDEIYSRLIAQAAARLRAGGWLVLELGYESEATVRPMLQAGWDEIETRRDLQGWVRALRARRR